MRLARCRVWRRVPAIAGLVLLAPAAVATPLLTAAEQQAIARPEPYPRAQHAIVKTPYIATDRDAALESVQIALSRTADGSTYIWYRPSGVSGTVNPTRTFRTSSGDLCRHLTVALSFAGDTRTMEGIACRQASGVWRLDG